MRRRARRKNQRSLFFVKLTMFISIISFSLIGISYSYFSEILSIVGTGTSKAYTIFPIPNRIEAEAYIGMYGLQTEDAIDEGGTLNIGWIDYGDWSEYKIVVPYNGFYDWNFRVADLDGGGYFDVYIDGLYVADYTVPNTGDWQNWDNIYSSSATYLEAGEHTVKLDFTGGTMNMNWFEITDPNMNRLVLPVQIEAEDWDDMFGILSQNTTDIGGGENIGWTHDGDWIEYEIYVPYTDSYNFDVRIASSLTTGVIEFQIDDVAIYNSAFPGSGGWQNWTNISFDSNLTSGNHTLKMYVDSRGFNINWYNITRN